VDIVVERFPKLVRLAKKQVAANEAMSKARKSGRREARLIHLPVQPRFPSSALSDLRC